MIAACKSSLETVKSFVSKIVKKDKEFLNSNLINRPDNLFKPLHSFLRNNSELSEEACNLMRMAVEEEVVAHYDAHYAPEVHAYSKDHLVSEQVMFVMEVVSRERTEIFTQVSKE